MAIDIAVKPKFPVVKGGKSPSLEYQFLINGATTQVDAFAALYSYIVNTLGVQVYTGVDILTVQDYGCQPFIVSDAFQSADIYDAHVSYGRDDNSGGSPNQQPGDPPVIDWDTTGGTQHISVAKSQRDYGGRHVRTNTPIAEPPSFENLIGVNGDEVEGVDIVVPTFSWSEKYTFPIAFADFTYAQGVIAPLTGRINAEPFRNFEAFDVLFMGASAQRKGFEQVEITYKFAGTPTVTDLDVGNGITVGLKYGWDYLWVAHKVGTAGDPEFSVRVPNSAHVAQVYEPGDFTTLGLP